MHEVLFQHITQALPLHATLGGMASATEARYTGIRVAFWLADHEQGAMRLLVAPTLGPVLEPWSGRVPINRDSLCCGRAVYSGQRARITSIRQMIADHPLASQLLDAGIQTCMSSPLTSVDGSVVGAASVYATDSAVMADLPDEVLTTLTELAQVALQREPVPGHVAAEQVPFADALLVTLIEQATGDMSQWRQSSQFERMIANLATHFIKLPAHAVDEGIRNALQTIGEFLSADRIVVTLINDDRRTFRTAYEWCLDDNDEKLNNQQNIFYDRLGWAKPYIENHRPFICGDATALPESANIEKALLQRLDVRSFALIPLLYGEKSRGFLAIANRAIAQPWQKLDMSLFEIAGNMLINAIQRKHYEEIFQNIEDNLREVNSMLVRESRVDPLTQIANRRFFDDKLESEFRRAMREHTCLALLFCDVDCFKTYNDTYGHLAGDQCLRSIAQALQHSFQRASDLAARYGGEEFAIIMPATKPDIAAQMGEKVRQAVFDLNLAHRTSKVASGIVTISVGVAFVIPTPGDSPQQLVDAADQALYEAKHAGRNRVCIAQSSEQIAG
jgi:diguanylate cyclase (GGDEF)-like protein